MSTWEETAADPRSTDELFSAALMELDEGSVERADQPSALVALQARPTPDVVDGSIELLDSSDSDERRLGVEVLAELRELQSGYVPAFVDRSVNALLGRAELEFDDEIVSRIARALGYRKDPRGIPALLRWLDHGDEHVRFQVACALPGCATPETEDVVAAALIQLTYDDVGDVRDYALFGFPQLTIDTPEIRDAMLACTADEDLDAAGQALVNLAMLGDPRVIAPLIVYIEGTSCGPYGYEAAAAIADPTLLPVLLSAVPIDRYADELARAISACETQTAHRA